MEQVNKDLLNEFDDAQVDATYATFWDRCWALLIDGLVIGVITGLINFYNELYSKSIPLLIIISLIGLVYKPFLEYRYGATVGKMALKLTVVNYDFKTISIKEALLRNVFEIGVRIYSLILAYAIFLTPGFRDVTSFKEYAVFSKSVSNGYWFSGIYAMIIIIEIIFLLNDKQKRSLHDRIGETLVIKK
jgi:uncharacterized RDD family membrane protein YckC